MATWKLDKNMPSSFYWALLFAVWARLVLSASQGGGPPPCSPHWAAADTLVRRAVSKQSDKLQHFDFRSHWAIGFARVNLRGGHTDAVAIGSVPGERVRGENAVLRKRPISLGERESAATDYGGVDGTASRNLTEVRAIDKRRKVEVDAQAAEVCDAEHVDGADAVVRNGGDETVASERSKRVSVMSNTIFIRGLPDFANEEWIAVLIGRTSVATDERTGARKIYLYRDDRGAPTGAIQRVFKAAGRYSVRVGLCLVECVPARTNAAM